MLSSSYLEIAVGVFVLYWLVIEVLKKTGFLERHDITAYGPVLLIRTKRGLRFLERLAKKKFWRYIADLGLPAVFLGMSFMFALLIYADYIMITHPPKPSALTSPRAALLIPGVNPFIPIVWGTIGLVVTLIVHEFSHAILCRVEKVKVKALGIILVLIPLGGFAEPDERELMDRERTSRLSRIRIFSAGVVSNFIVAAIAFGIFIYLLGFVGPRVVLVKDRSIAGVVLEVNGKKVYDRKDVLEAIGHSKYVTFLVKNKTKTYKLTVPNIMGVKIVGLFRLGNKTFPAEKAGLKKGMIIIKINNETVKTPEDFRRIMSKTKPGQTITVWVYDNGTIKAFNVTLANMNGHGFLGVYIELLDCIGGVNLAYTAATLNALRSIPKYLTTINGWLYVMSLPFVRFQGFVGEYTMLFSAPQWLFWILNTLYWIGWINVYVGLFNCLPAVPLDGGRVFHEAFSAILERRYGKRAEEISMKVVKFFAFVVFLSILLSIAIPNLQGLI